MSSISSKTPQKSRKEKEKERDRERDKERKLSQQEPNNERLKTVVRRLPPNLPEEIFWQSVQSWVTEDTAVWKTYYPGKIRKRANKENIPSRAYIAFKTKEQLELFSREYDGHVFRDKTGAESQAVVEYAPYSKVPFEKRKPDNRNATIDKDEDYISFIESLKGPTNAEHVTLESLIASTQPVPQPKSTPLLEALKAEKSANKDKEAILRNHAHYSQIISPVARKEDKKPQASKASFEGTSANVSTNNVAATGGKKSSKKGQHHVQAAPPTVVKAVTSSDVAAATPSESPARRSRPVIGLASRQFEAALSGVGGRERRAKRERVKEEKDSPAPAGSDNGPSSEATPSVAVPPRHGAGATGLDEVEPLPSPKKERSRRSGGRGGGGAGGASGAAPPVKISGILQRVDSAPPAAIEHGESSVNVSVNSTTITTGMVGDGNRGGGRRGRGRRRGHV